jgi:hypothetical protein
VDLNKLTTSDKIIAGSGIVLFIAYFMPWFTASYDAGPIDVDYSASGSDVGFLWATLPMLIGLVLAAWVIATKLFDVKMPDLPMPAGQLVLGLGALAAVLVVLKLLIGIDDDGAEAFGVDVSRSIGIFLAALAAIGLAVGGFLKYQAGEDAPATGGDTGTAPF